MADLNLTREQLGELIQAKLPAGATREQLHEHIRGKDKLIEYIMHTLARQATTLLDIREKMVQHKEAIEHVADDVFGAEDRPGLVGFEEPKIVMPGTN